jgi:hypothetical protein
MEITQCNDWTALRSRPVASSIERLVAPAALSIKGGVRPQAGFDATAMGPQTWSSPIT